MISTKHKIINIKKELPGRFIKKNQSRYDTEPFTFQRNTASKIEVSKYNAEAGNLSL